MKTLILGMGNDLLADDAVGLKVARKLRETVRSPDVAVEETCLASLELLDLLAGFDRAILVDTIQTRNGKVGDVYLLSLDDLSGGSPPASLHHVDLPTVLAIGESLGVQMPKDVRIVAVEAGDVSTFGGECCAEVMAAIPKILNLVHDELSAVSPHHHAVYYRLVTAQTAEERREERWEIQAEGRNG